MVRKKMAIDLLHKMLVFNPFKRFTAKECIEHSYFDGIREQDYDKFQDKSFDWAFDDIELDKELIQRLIYQEALKFHPEIPTSTTNSTSSTEVEENDTEKKCNNNKLKENIIKQPELAESSKQSESTPEKCKELNNKINKSIQTKLNPSEDELKGKEKNK